LNTSTLVQKLWNYCNVLRDDGMSYGGYVEQLTYLLFLKMADERSRPPYNQPSLIPAQYAWPALLARDGDELFDHYRHTLEALGSEKGTLALAADPGERFDVVLANPPFGKKSSTMIVGEDGRTSTEKDIIERDDFWATTSNKQLNFVQHIKTLLKSHGRAAVVVPDNVLLQEASRRDPVDQEALDLRPAHQQALHAEDQFVAAGRSGRVLAAVQTIEPPHPCADVEHGHAGRPLAYRRVGLPRQLSP
jgi:type I restriction-modification system DNA methylase subunit